MSKILSRINLTQKKLPIIYYYRIKYIYFADMVIPNNISHCLNPWALTQPKPTINPPTHIQPHAPTFIYIPANCHENVTAKEH